MDGLVRQAGKAHHTQDAKTSTVSDFVSYLDRRGYLIGRVEQVGYRHVKGYVADLQARTVSRNGTAEQLSARTIQNKVSHLRTVLETAGRAQFVREQLSSEKLGLEEGSRIGTHRAITEVEYRDVVALASMRDEGIAAGLRLCYELGLRGMEAVRSGGSLDAWAQALRDGGRLAVMDGTKGGRLRWLDADSLPDRAAAAEAVRLAIEVAEARGGHLLDCETLRQAEDKWGNVTSACGLVKDLAPHSLRYAFACRYIDARLAEGRSLPRALGMCADALGHAHSRDSWVRMVYAREHLAETDED